MMHVDVDDHACSFARPLSIGCPYFKPGASGPAGTGNAHTQLGCAYIKKRAQPEVRSITITRILLQVGRFYVGRFYKGLKSMDGKDRPANQ
jgi:hypothetical protein